MNKDRNDLLAGLLLIVAIIGLVAGVVMLAGFQEVLGTRTYIVRFDLTENLGGLESGASVRLGGRSIGVVSAVRFTDDGPGGAPTATEVVIRVSSDLQIREGATPLLELPLFGAQGVINFITLGDAAVLPPGSVIKGTIAPPSFLAQAGWGDDEKQNLSNLLRNASQAGEKLNATLDRFSDGPLADIQSVTADVREKWPDWSERVDSITRNADTTLARAPELAESLDQRLEQLREALATAQGYLDDNREDVRAAVERFRSVGERADAFTERLNTEITDLAKGFLEDGRAAIDRGKDAIDTVAQLIGEQRPAIRRSLANFRLASDQLRDTLLEVRRAPWRLLYRPDTRELDFELLYDSARSYAGAVSDLRAATESLESVMASNRDRQVLSEGDFDDMLSAIERAFQRYEQAEQRFLERLLDEAPDASRR